jgi:hypothetical protein
MTTRFLRSIDNRIEISVAARSNRGRGPRAIGSGNGDQGGDRRRADCQKYNDAPIRAWPKACNGQNLKPGDEGTPKRKPSSKWDPDRVREVARARSARAATTSPA